MKTTRWEVPDISISYRAYPFLEPDAEIGLSEVWVEAHRDKWNGVLIQFNQQTQPLFVDEAKLMIQAWQLVVEWGTKLTNNTHRDIVVDEDMYSDQARSK